MNTSLILALQILVIATPTPHSTTGSMQRYERAGPEAAWVPAGSPIRVSVGARGISPQKKEGDRKTPAGHYPLGLAFGTASPQEGSWPYYQVRGPDLCVDDPRSASYGRLIGPEGTVAQPDWRSTEDLRMYRRAILVDYNRAPAIAGKGSCIFLHDWAYIDEPTLGCAAMRSEDLDLILHWLRPAAKPAILIGVAPSPSDLLPAPTTRSR